VPRCGLSRHVVCLQAYQSRGAPGHGARALRSMRALKHHAPIEQPGWFRLFPSTAPPPPRATNHHAITTPGYCAHSPLPPSWLYSVLKSRRQEFRHVWCLIYVRAESDVKVSPCVRDDTVHITPSRPRRSNCCMLPIVFDRDGYSTKLGAFGSTMILARCIRPATDAAPPELHITKRNQ